jgi:hypothetical protein
VFCFSFQQLGLCKDRDVVGERCPIKIIDSDLLAEGRVWIIDEFTKVVKFDRFEFLKKQIGVISIQEL